MFIKKLALSLTGCLILALMLAACFSDFGYDGENGNVIINTGLDGDARALNGGAAPLPEVLEDTVFTVKFYFYAKSPDPLVTRTFSGSGKGSISVPAGTYSDIQVTATYRDGTEYAYGQAVILLEGITSLEISGGKNDPVNIRMSYEKYPLKLVGNGGNFNGASSKIVFVEKSSYLSGIQVTANEPAGKTGYNCRFAGWAWSPSAGQSLNPDQTSFFTDAPYYNFTLYAFWSNYTLGADGPGGGKIFYVNPTNPSAGFTVDGYGTAWYLETALEDEIIWWANPEKIIPNISSISMDDSVTPNKIGNGRRDTSLIVKYLNSQGQSNSAAHVAASATIGDKNDWFLPSSGELKALYSYWNSIDKLSNYNFKVSASDYYWSSTQQVYQPEDIGASVIHFSNGLDSIVKMNMMYLVRPIRAF